MEYYISPGHLQTFHYYFFCLGIVSFTSAVLYWGYGLTYLFLAFYVIHSVISWYISWFLHTRVREIFVINSPRYAASHFLITMWSCGLAAVLWYLFLVQYEAVLNALIFINFFAVFLGFIWYLMIRFKFMEKVFNWQEKRDFKIAKDIVVGFRNRNGLKLVDDREMEEYRWGSNSRIDCLFLQAKGQLNSGNESAFVETIRLIETNLCDAKVGELEKRIGNIRKGVVSETDQSLIQTYQNLIHDYGKRMAEYDRLFYSKFPK